MFRHWYGTGIAMRLDAIVHGNLDVVVVSAGLLCDRCGKKKTMEVYQRSSWFLLIFGFALLAATLQGTFPEFYIFAATYCLLDNSFRATNTGP